jgi:parvulin-like peptidyl-prolyl isomerase
MSASQPLPPEAVVAEVGPRKILVADVWDVLAVQRRRDIAQNRLDSFTLAASEKVMTDLVDARLFSLAARSHGLDRKPEIIRRLDNIVDEALAQFEVADRLQRVTLDDAAVRGYFDAHQSEFREPDQVHARQILVRTQAEAESLLGQLKAGAVFADLARQYNTDSTKATGGDLGLVRRGVMVAAFEKALFDLRVGETSSIVQTAFGYHIIKAEEIQPGRLPEFDTVKQAVQRKALEAHIAEAREELRRKYPVHIDKDLLAAIGK